MLLRRQIQVASSLPTDARLSSIPNRSAINRATMCRVHRKKSKPCWRGSLPLIQRNTCRFCLSVNLGGRPVPLLDRSGSPRPPRLTLSQPLINRRTAEAVGGDPCTRWLTFLHSLNRHPPDLGQRLVIQCSAVANHTGEYIMHAGNLQGLCRLNSDLLTHPI